MTTPPPPPPPPPHLPPKQRKWRKIHHPKLFDPSLSRLEYFLDQEPTFEQAYSEKRWYYDTNLEAIDFLVSDN